MEIVFVCLFYKWGKNMIYGIYRVERVASPNEYSTYNAQNNRSTVGIKGKVNNRIGEYP